MSHHGRRDIVYCEFTGRLCCVNDSLLANGFAGFPSCAAFVDYTPRLDLYTMVYRTVDDHSRFTAMIKCLFKMSVLDNKIQHINHAYNIYPFRSAL